MSADVLVCARAGQRCLRFSEFSLHVVITNASERKNLDNKSLIRRFEVQYQSNKGHFNDFVCVVFVIRMRLYMRLIRFSDDVGCISKTGGQTRKDLKMK